MIALLTLLWFVWMFSMWFWSRQLERRIERLEEGLRLSADLFRAMQATRNAHQEAITGILDILTKMAR